MGDMASNSERNWPRRFLLPIDTAVSVLVTTARTVTMAAIARLLKIAVTATVSIDEEEKSESKSCLYHFNVKVYAPVLVSAA